MFISSISPDGETSHPVLWCLDVASETPHWMMDIGHDGDDIGSSNPIVTQTLTGAPLVVAVSEYNVRCPLVVAVADCALPAACVSHMQLWFFSEGKACPSNTWEAACSGNGNCDCQSGICTCNADSCFTGPACDIVRILLLPVPCAASRDVAVSCVRAAVVRQPLCWLQQRRLSVRPVLDRANLHPASVWRPRSEVRTHIPSQLPVSGVAMCLCFGLPACSCNAGQCTCENCWSGNTCQTEKNCGSHSWGCGADGNCACLPCWSGPLCDQPSAFPAGVAYLAWCFALVFECSVAVPCLLADWPCSELWSEPAV